MLMFRRRRGTTPSVSTPISTNVLSAFTPIPTDVHAPQTFPLINEDNEVSPYIWDLRPRKKKVVDATGEGGSSLGRRLSRR